MGNKAAGLLAALLLQVSAPAWAGAKHWSVVASPNAGYAPTSLSATTCVTASDCWAVGRTEIGQTFADTALMRWNGNDWQVVPSPSVEKQTNGLVAITCLSSSSCWAVGYRIILQTVQVQTLILRWDGDSWSIVASPNVGNGFNALYGVACAGESDCWAVGFENGGSRASTVIQRWDGTAWTVQDSPNPGGQHNVFNAVTCLSASNCWAVGYSGAAGARSSLVAQWNGTSWTATALPNAPGAQENTLRSVACNSATDCWGVGDSYNGAAHQPLVERWDGTSWTTPTLIPSGAVDSVLSQVACASASDCWAVGHSSNAAVDASQLDQNLILHWNGTLWLPSSAPADPGATYASDLAGVTCASPSECWAVGSVYPSGSGRPQIARWDGASWTAAVAPDVAATPSNFLDGVACASSSDCWAVGFDFYGNVARSMTMHWDGDAWEVRPSPNTALDRNNYLGDVTCVSSADCWAVGSATDSIGVQDQTLAMHWDGTAWSIVSTSPVDTRQEAEASLEGVACASSSDCWAVGYSLIQDYQALFEHWNGTAWALVPAPPALNDATTRSILYDVACTAASDCTAVGVQWTSPLTGNSLYQTLVEHWDGSAWTIVSSPNTSTEQDNILSGVTCVSATDCWAVGSSDNYGQALVERWDGTSWTIVPAPQVGSILNDVTCLSPSDCWAAGPYYSANPPAKTLLIHWDGTAWSKAQTPNGGAGQSNNVSAIACASASECWAVGRYTVKGNSRTLALHYTQNRPPHASLAADKAGGLAPLGVAFTVGATDPDADDTASYELDFGDGSAHASGAATPHARVSHTYSAAGTFTPTLTVTDSWGDASTATTSVTATILAPAVTLSQDTSNRDVSAGAVDVAFTANASGFPPGDTLVYTYTFGDGATDTPAASPETSHHVYTAAGDYPAHVTVSDGTSIVNSATIVVAVTQTVTVSDSDPPTAALVIAGFSPANGVAPLTVTFDGSGSHGSDQAALASYVLDFGDGSQAPGEGAPGQISHLYRAAGTYSAVLTVTDGHGRTATARASISVAAGPGTIAELVVSPSSALTGEMLTFDGSGSIAASGTTIHSYTFDLGDGTASAPHLVTQTVGQVDVPDPGKLRYAYSKAGHFAPTLTVTDSNSGTAKSKPLSVEVTPRPAATPVAPSGGGAFGWLGLLPLLLAGLRRRNSRR